MYDTCLRYVTALRHLKQCVNIGNLGITPNYGLGGKSAQRASRSMENQVQLQS
ncbi:hypothetical protein PVK06_019200 [Gossypium arboreum]|uniref:Uncharacterized protein n=1 Tax=Gossypium arboreum TaxID=29729 RepID=A0ABR0PJD1_GOSAR|nr:hypothetical protein PVK06_019200 [Gossypium arboreum]